MTKRLASLLSLLCLLTLGTVGPAVGMPSAGADPYTALVNTQCEVTTPVAKSGERFEVTVRVRANSTTDPQGRVTVRLQRTPGGEIWKKTVAFSGTPVHLVGPELEASGSYRATAVFHAAEGSIFRGCSGSAAFTVDQDGSTDDDPDDGGSQGGILPDTGGPNLWWLVLGLALVGTGAGTVVIARRGGDRGREALTEA